MARDWSDCCTHTHTKRELSPSRGGRDIPWEKLVQLRKTVHGPVSPNSARACSLIDFSTGSVPPAGHEPFFPPPRSSLSDEIRYEIFFLGFVSRFFLNEGGGVFVETRFENGLERIVVKMFSLLSASKRTVK